MTDADEIFIPCPECGTQLKASAQRLCDLAAKPIQFGCGHVTVLRASNLRNPIAPPSWDIPFDMSFAEFCYTVGAFVGLVIWPSAG